jgi:splicing factor 3B subunit 3
MNLLNNTLQKPTCITQAISGSFSGAKSQDILISRGKILELWKQEENSAKMNVILSSEVFGLIRCISAFRVTGKQN